MMSKSPRPSADGYESFLADLRLDADRRSRGASREGDRRVVRLDTERDRRQGADRRQSDRRTSVERRTPSEDQFTWDDTQRIHMMLRYPDRSTACPRCAGLLMLGPEERHDGIPTREVHCTSCRFGTVVAP